jgi:type I restriction enzyme S subunit
MSDEIDVMLKNDLRRFNTYPRYRDSGVDWLQQIPASWEVRRLKHLCLMNAGSGITAEDIESDGPYPVFGGNGVRGYCDAYTHEGAHPLIGRQGALCGCVTLADGRFWASEHAIVVRPADGVDAHWLTAVLTAMSLNQYSESAAQPGLAVDNITVLEAPFPTLREQRSIAVFLDKETSRINKLLASKERLVTLLQERRTALITRAVTRGLNLTAPMKDAGVEWLGEIPAHWEVKPLRTTIVSCQNGVWGEDPDGVRDVICVRVADFDRVRLGVHLTDPTMRAVDARVVADRGLRPGDLLLEKSGGGENQPVGAVVLFTDQVPAVCSNFVARVVVSESNDSEFLVYLHKALYSMRINTKHIKQSTGIQNLDSASYFGEAVAIPPLAEQQQIAMYLSAETRRLDELITRIRLAITRLHELRTALINAAVTGKIDVRDASEGVISADAAA